MQAKCLNCGAEYSGKFCPTCGQKQATHRITFPGILHEIPHSVFHLDKGLFYTFVQLLYRPGKAITDYVGGKRVNYSGPIGYLILLCAISSFITHFSAGSIHVSMTISRGVLFPHVAEFFKEYMALMFCALVPFISFWSWLFNRDTHYNYWENFVLNVYLIAQFNLFFIINTLLQALNVYRSPKVTPMLICFMGYLAFAYTQFFKCKRSWKGLLKTLIMYVVISYTLITGLTVIGFMTPWW